jgi:hypothetical protein
VESVSNNSTFPDELCGLSSETFVIFGSSFVDINFQYPDISCQDSVNHKNSYHLDQDRGIKNSSFLQQGRKQCKMTTQAFEGQKMLQVLPTNCLYSE